MQFFYPGEIEIKSVGSCGGRKTEPGEKPSEQGESQQQNQNPHMALDRNRTPATLVGGKI